jgi:hypothetical protein
MTEMPVEAPAEVVEAPPEVVDDAPAMPTSENCRWCGAAHDQMPDDPSDWLCADCGRYQDAMICPTCGGLARVSLLPANMVPAPVLSKKGKK